MSMSAHRMTTSIVRSPSLRTLLLVLIVALMVGTTLSFRSASAGSSAIDLSHRYIVFLDGVNSSGDTSKPLNDSFKIIETQLRSNGISHFVYFSYGAVKYAVDKNKP